MDFNAKPYLNQADTNKRNQQVRLMRQIYEKAERVVVWLGAKAQYTPPGNAPYPYP